MAFLVQTHSNRVSTDTLRSLFEHCPNHIGLMVDHVVLDTIERQPERQLPALLAFGSPLRKTCTNTNSLRCRFLVCSDHVQNAYDQRDPTILFDLLLRVHL